MHIKRHGFCKLSGSLGSDINNANAKILSATTANMATATRSAETAKARSQISRYTSRAPTSPSSASAHHLYGTPNRKPRLVQLGSRRLFWGGGEEMASCGGDTMTAGTFQGEMPALCGGDYLHNACMHLMTLTPQHTTSAVSRRGG